MDNYASLDTFYQKLLAGGIAVTRVDVDDIFKEIKSENKVISEIVAYQIAYERAESKYAKFKSDFHGELLKRNVFLSRTDLESFVVKMVKSNADKRTEDIPIERAMAEAELMYEQFLKMRRAISYSWDGKERRTFQR